MRHTKMQRLQFKNKYRMPKARQERYLSRWHQWHFNQRTK